ncbi:hypothetical protein JW906_05425 [bacterium]|nr:hypothetical protein [bacterium]
MKSHNRIALIFIFIPAALAYPRSWPRLEFPSTIAGDKLWIGTPKGLYQYQYDEDTWAVFGTHNGLPSDHIQILTWDGEWLWAGTPEGVAAGNIQLNQWLVYSEKNGLPGNRILCIAPEEDYMWVGTDRGAARYDKIIQEWEKFTVQTGLPDSMVYDIVSDGGLVYFATARGLAEYDVRFEKWRYYGNDNGIPSDTIRFLYPTADYLWLFTDRGPARFHRQLHTAVPYVNPQLEFSAVHDLAAVGEQLWAATESGVYLYDPANAIWREFPERSNLPDSAVQALCFDMNNRWFSTRKGIMLHNVSDGSWKRFDKAQGLSSEWYDAASAYRDRIFLINPGTIDHYRPGENRWFVYPLARQPSGSKKPSWISLDRERGSTARFGENVHLGLSGTRITNRFQYDAEFPSSGSGRTSSRSVSRTDLKAQLDLPRGRMVNGFYDNTDFSQTLYGIRYRGGASDLVQEASWGDVRFEPGKSEILPGMGLFGVSARLEAGKKTERYKRSLFSARGFSGERTTARETEFFTGNLRSSGTTLADTGYVRRVFFRIGGVDEAFPVDEGTERIDMDDGDPATNTANTEAQTVIAGAAGDFDRLHPVLDYRLDSKTGVVRFLIGIPPKAILVVRGISRGVPFERVIKTPGRWDHALVNRYSLGGMEIHPYSLRLEVFDGQGVRHPLSEFGLDSDGDGRVDPECIDFKEGILAFPQERPFPQSVYDSLRAVSQYRIGVRFQSDRPFFALKHANLVRGSELVTVDGEPLVPGSDYTLDYWVGTLLFLKEGVIAEDSDIRVDYEYYRNAKEQFRMGGIGFSPSDNVLVEVSGFGFDKNTPRGDLDSVQGMDAFGEFRWRALDLDWKFTPQYAWDRGGEDGGSRVLVRTDASSKRIRLFSEYEKIDTGYQSLFDRKFQLGDLGERSGLGVRFLPVDWFDMSGGWTRQASQPRNGSSGVAEEWTGRAVVNKPLYPAFSISARKRTYDTLDVRSDKNTIRGDFDYKVPEPVLSKLSFRSLHLYGVWRRSWESAPQNPSDPFLLKTQVFSGITDSGFEAQSPDMRVVSYDLQIPSDFSRSNNPFWSANPRGLTLPAASGGESSICREEDIDIRSLMPGQAPGNALADRFKKRVLGPESERMILKKSYATTGIGFSDGVMESECGKKIHDNRYFRIDFAPADQIQMNAYFRENRYQTGESFDLMGRYPYNHERKLFMTATVDRVPGINLFVLYQGELAERYASPLKDVRDRSLDRSCLATLRIVPGRWAAYLSPYTFQIEYQPAFQGFMSHASGNHSWTGRFWEFPQDGSSCLDRNDAVVLRNEWRPWNTLTLYLDYETGSGLSKDWDSLLGTRRRRIFQKTEFRPTINSQMTFQYQRLRDEKETYSVFTRDNPIFWLENRWSDRLQTQCNVSFLREERRTGRLIETVSTFSPLAGFTYRMNRSGVRLEIRNNLSLSFHRNNKPSFRFGYNRFSDDLTVDYSPLSILIFQLKGGASYQNQMSSSTGSWIFAFQLRMTAQL